MSEHWSTEKVSSEQKIADRVKKLRGRRSQADFARELGFSRNYLSMIENGRKPGDDFVEIVEKLEATHRSEHQLASFGVPGGLAAALQDRDVGESDLSVREEPIFPADMRVQSGEDWLASRPAPSDPLRAYSDDDLARLVETCRAHDPTSPMVLAVADELLRRLRQGTEDLEARLVSKQQQQQAPQ